MKLHWLVPTVVVVGATLSSCNSDSSCVLDEDCFRGERCVEQRCGVPGGNASSNGFSETMLDGEDLVCAASERKIETLDGFYCAVRCQSGSCGGLSFRCADDWCVDNTLPTVPASDDACSADCGELASCQQFTAGENSLGYCAYQWGNCDSAVTYAVVCWPRDGLQHCECRRDEVVVRNFQVSSIRCDASDKLEFGDDCGWRLEGD